jgi:hypothetical protein
MVPQFKVLRYVERPVCLPKDPEEDSSNGSYRSRSSELSWDAPAPYDDDPPSDDRWGG